jgi:hypothetical protein
VPASPRKSGGRAASGSPSPQTSLSLSFDDEPVKAIKAPKEKTPKEAVAKVAPAEAESASTEPDVATKPKKAAAKVDSTKLDSTKVESTKPTLDLKGKKVRAPKDLALQYGEKPTERPTTPVIAEAETAKKRLTKVQREARRELIKPDEGLIERLARATQIQVVKPKSEPRGKGWKFMCGRCGNTSYFQIPAALCDCGAIAIKD